VVPSRISPPVKRIPFNFFGLCPLPHSQMPSDGFFGYPTRLYSKKFWRCSSELVPFRPLGFPYFFLLVHSLASDVLSPPFFFPWHDQGSPPPLPVFFLGLKFRALIASPLDLFSLGEISIFPRAKGSAGPLFFVHFPLLFAFGPGSGFLSRRFVSGVFGVFFGWGAGVCGVGSFFSSRGKFRPRMWFLTSPPSKLPATLGASSLPVHHPCGLFLTLLADCFSSFFITGFTR